MNWTETTLDILGLNDTEKAILESLSIAKSVQDLALDTKLSRTGINHSLKKLYKKDLITTLRNGKRKLYLAITFKELSLKLQRLQDTINVESTNKKGARIKTSKENEFIIHVGSKDIISMYERIMSLHKGERWKAIQPNKSWMNMHQKLTKRELIHINNAIRENDIIVDAIVQDNAYMLYHEFFKKDPEVLQEVAESFTGRSADYTSLPHSFFDYHTEIWFFERTFSIINWKEEVAIEITNSDIMNFMKDLFEIAKEKGVKVDHNQAMSEILGEKMEAK